MSRWRRWAALEQELRAAGGSLIAGIDEVGRGPLAGPVVACAVIMPEGRRLAGVDDSKRLPPPERQRLAQAIRSRAVALGIGAASVREIERLNIYHATVLAMRRAIARLGVTPDHVVLDGKPIRTLGMPHRAIVGGDAECYPVACASIVAKVTRDRVMQALSLRHPSYGWDHNVGYATPAHLRGMRDHGVTRHHRAGFLPVAQLTMDFAAVPSGMLSHGLGEEGFVPGDLLAGEMLEGIDGSVRPSAS